MSASGSEVRCPGRGCKPLPLPQVLRRLWAQIAALGVGQVILTNAEKVERDYFDSHVMIESGYRPLLVEGREDNFKITTPADLARFEFVLSQRHR